MNFISETRRRILADLAAARDDRADHERFRDALEAHERSIDRHRRVSNDADASEAAYGLAQRRFDQTQSDLYCLVEEILCVPAQRLSRALSA